MGGDGGFTAQLPATQLPLLPRKAVQTQPQPRELVHGD
jgi:hypothetical protein